MSILSPAGGEGEARRDDALNLLRVRRSGLIRPAAHARPLSVWRLADPAAAFARLASLSTVSN